MSKVSVKRAAQRARTEDRVAREKASRQQTGDSFQNFALGVGIGTQSPISANGYGFYPITRERTKLEWMYRGSWAAGIGIDIIADDMTREGVELTGNLEPDQKEELEEVATELEIWTKLNESIKWGRLYGGAIAVILIAGQDPSTPLRVETVGPNQFKGLLVLDRWMVSPSLEDLVTEIGPELGMPKYYTVDSMASAMRGQKIHHSRCIRFGGDKLPYWQAVSENLWDMTVLERLYDRLSSFDQATIGMAQLVFKSYLRYFKIENYRNIVGGLGGAQALKGLMEMVANMRMFASNEGITLIDAKDDMVTTQGSSFTGVAECILQLAQQISGGWQIPLVRLLGQSPAGLNSTGESDLKTYYDGIRRRQTVKKPGITKIYRCLARSQRIDISQGFGIAFKSLWQLDEPAKSEIASKDTKTVLDVWDTGKISDRRALKELQKSGQVTGRWQFTDEEIEAASDELPPPPSEQPDIPIPGAPGAGPKPDDGNQPESKSNPLPGEA